MKYIDRMGNVTVEENGQDKLLRHLYNDRGGRLCLRVLVSPWISKMAGRLLNTGFSARFVGDFVEKNRDFLLTNREKLCKFNFNNDQCDDRENVTASISESRRLL